jgi:serine/threonine-protein kinase
MGFTEAFREFGIDVPELPVDEAAQRIRARSVRLELAWALDYWSTKRIFVASAIRAMIEQKTGVRQADRPQLNWQHLLEVAKVADPDPWRNRLRDAMKRGNDRNTLLDLAATAPMRQLSPSTLYLLGDALQKALDRPAALTLLLKAHSVYPGDLLLNETLAEFYHAKVGVPRFDEASRFYSAALAIRPSSAYLRTGLGQVLLGRSMYVEAVTEFNAALHLEPNRLDALAGRATAYMQLLWRTEALADFTRLIQLDPMPGRWHSRGDAHRWMLQRELAIADYTRALEMDATFWPALAARAQVYAALDQWGQAAKDLEAAVAVQPDVVYTWHHLASFRAAAGDIAPYRRACRSMVANLGSTKDPVIAQRVALSCLLMPSPAGEQQKPLQLIEFSAARIPQDPWCMVTRGLSLYRTDQFQQAGKLLRAVLKRWPEEPYQREGVGEEPLVCWLILALTDERLGQAEPARRWLNKAAERMAVLKKIDSARLAGEPGFLRTNSDVRALCVALRREAEERLDKSP